MTEESNGIEEVSDFTEHNKKEPALQAKPIDIEQIKNSFYSIEQSIDFLNIQNGLKYTINDLDDFVSRGRLTPCLPYKGRLIRVVKFDEYDFHSNFDDMYFDTLTDIDGYITPHDDATTKALGELSGQEGISFLDVKIPYKPMNLVDYGAMSNISYWSEAPYSIFSNKNINEYQVTNGANLYKFNDKKGIEIQRHIYLSHCKFHIKQLTGFIDRPKSTRDETVTQEQAEHQKPNASQLNLGKEQNLQAHNTSEVTPLLKFVRERYTPLTRVIRNIINIEPAITIDQLWSKLQLMAQNEEPPFTKTININTLKYIAGDQAKDNYKYLTRKNLRDLF